MWPWIIPLKFTETVKQNYPFYTTDRVLRGKTKMMAWKHFENLKALDLNWVKFYYYWSFYRHVIHWPSTDKTGNPNNWDHFLCVEALSLEHLWLNIKALSQRERMECSMEGIKHWQFKRRKEKKNRAHHNAVEKNTNISSPCPPVSIGKGLGHLLWHWESPRGPPSSPTKNPSNFHGIHNCIFNLIYYLFIHLLFIYPLFVNSFILPEGDEV